MKVFVKKNIKALVAGTLALAAVSASAASWTLYYKTHYNYSPSPYEFTNVRGCSWNYVTSYGGSWGVQHLYTANGSCAYGEQQVNYSTGGGYNNTSVYHR